MTRRRPPDFQLARAVREAGFTPRAGDADALLELLADDAVEHDAERALLQLGRDAADAAARRLRDARPPLRPRLARLLGRLGDPAGVLPALLDDADPATARAAAVALGKAGGPAAEEALLRRWDGEARPEHRRALAEALGKVGGPASLARLRDLTTDDPELRRIAARAVLMLERTSARGEPSRVDAAAAPARPLAVVVRCRAGLEALCAEELAELGGRAVAPGAVAATLAGPLSRLFRARTALGFAFPLPPRRGTTLEDAVAGVLASDAAAEIFARFTVGPIRYRLAWARGGHRRAAVWEIARRVAERRPELVNDPTATTWEATIHERAGGEVAVELAPRRLDDPRFAWRRGDVPAASHPTIAAALARVAEARADDVVWDPFVGSGAELVERALLGPYARLVGTDLDQAALRVAAANLAAAGVARATLVRADACVHDPGGATLVLTNPPMGRRVHRGDVGPLLDRFVDHAARVLAPGGRLVWVSPLPARTAARAARAGLALARTIDVDLGGFTGQLQRFVR